MKSLDEIRSSFRTTVIAVGQDGGAYVVDMGYGKISVVASFGDGWDHVSASYKTRCPNWEEMCMVKRIFFRDDETVIQYHPAAEDYVNLHPFCLHLWKSQTIEFPKPPKYMIGPG